MLSPWRSIFAASMVGNWYLRFLRSSWKVVTTKLARATILYLPCWWRFMLQPPHSSSYGERMVNSLKNEGLEIGEGAVWGCVMRLIECWGCVSAAVVAWSGWLWVVRLHVHGRVTTCVPVSLHPAVVWTWYLMCLRYSWKGGAIIRARTTVSFSLCGGLWCIRYLSFSLFTPLRFDAPFFDILSEWLFINCPICGKMFHNKS